MAEAGALLGAGGLAALALAPARWPRLAGLAAWAVGCALLGLELAPSGREVELVAAGVGGLALAAALAVPFLRWPWLVPVLALAFVPIRIPISIEGEERNLLLPLYAVIAGAAVALGWRLLRGDGRRRELGPITWPFAAFVGWVGLSLLWTADLREGAVSFAAFYLPFGLLAVVLARLPWSRRWLGVLCGELVALALVFAGVGLLQWLTRDVFWNPKVIVGNAYAPFYRVNSVFWDPSIYGRFLVLAILACLALVLARTDRKTALGAVAAIAVAWAGLVVSFSQSSFAALMVVVLAAAALAWGRRALLTLGLSAVLLVSVGFTAPQLRHAILQDTEAALDRATSGRAGLIANGIGISADHPVVGVGLGSFRDAYADRVGLRGAEPQRAASHNTPVTVAAETGLPGLALFGWLLLAAVAVPLRRASGSFAGRASLIVGLSLMAIAVHSLFYNAFFEDPMSWGYLGLGAVVAGWRGTRDR